MYKRTIKGKEYVLYENEEDFYQHRPKSVLHDDWRTAKTGQWIKTDDGKVTKSLNAVPLNTIKRLLTTFGLLLVWQTANALRIMAVSLCMIFGVLAKWVGMKKP